MLHIFVSLKSQLGLLMDLVLEHFIEERKSLILCLFPIGLQGLHSFLEVSIQSGQFQHCAICNMQLIICIVKQITGLRRANPRCVCAILLKHVINGLKVTQLFAHLLAINQNISIAEVASRPQLRKVLPHGSMVEKSHD